MLPGPLPYTGPAFQAWTSQKPRVIASHNHLDRASVPAEPRRLVHQLLEVKVQELKHKVQALVTMDDVEQPARIW